MIKYLIFLSYLSIITLVNLTTIANDNSSTNGQTILIDISHNQKFRNNPEAMKEGDINRAKYLVSEIKSSVESLGAGIGYLSDKINSGSLENCDVLFIHVPASNYSESEIKVIDDYIRKGGSLFLIMEEDYWTTLELSNVNDIIKPFGMWFEGQIDDPTSGGHTKAGNITSQSLKIPFHGGRIVKGGTPFCYSNHSDETPFGMYKQLENGGKIVIMGDGMVALFMTSWDGVDGYQCSEFMHNVFKWLLE